MHAHAHAGKGPAIALPGKLRAAWDALITTEGAVLGLTDCHAFLENKMVNDVFYEGMFKGRPCIVKCSSRAPDSIRNEYEMSKRLFAEAPVCAEPLAHYVTHDGKKAFVVTAKLPNGMPPADPAADILRIARALRQTGIVHRDISVNNLLTDADGHLRLIDFQFAVDRRNYGESAFMRHHPTYRYVIFGSCEGLGIGMWNDLLGYGLLACLDHYAPSACGARAELARAVATFTFSSRVPFPLHAYMYARKLIWFLQKRLSRKPALEWRYARVTRLLAHTPSFLSR